jgi:hypothetical protein
VFHPRFCFDKVVLPKGYIDENYVIDNIFRLVGTFLKLIVDKYTTHTTLVLVSHHSFPFVATASYFLVCCCCCGGVLRFATATKLFGLRYHLTQFICVVLVRP